MKKKKKRRQRLCRVCKKRPVWIGGDVKNPGPVCKKCYHAHVWPERLAVSRLMIRKSSEELARSVGQDELGVQAARMDTSQTAVIASRKEP